MKLYERLGLSLEDFKELLQQKLTEDASMVDIGREFGVSATAIHTWMKKFNIKRRIELRSKEWLENEYIKNQKSAEEIALQLGVSSPAVLWYLNKFKIPKRTRSEAQKIANKKRLISPLHEFGSHRSYGYCFRYREIYCRSIPELMWLIDHDHDFDRIKWEPFVFRNHKPDVLFDNVVYEIKSSRSSLTDDMLHRYNTIGKAIKDELGYDYKMVFMRDLYPDKYQSLLQEAKNRSAKKGQEGPAIVWL